MDPCLCGVVVGGGGTPAPGGLLVEGNTEPPKTDFGALPKVGPPNTDVVDPNTLPVAVPRVPNADG